MKKTKADCEKVKPQADCEKVKSERIARREARDKLKEEHVPPNSVKALRERVTLIENTLGIDTV